MNAVAEPNWGALVRVAKQQVRLATRGLDVDGLVDVYLDEIPVRLSRRGSPGQAGRAGCYSYQGCGAVGHVTINVGVCYTEERFMAVLYHELAHAVCHWIHADQQDTHGPKWKAIMVQLGQPPERCHSYQDRR